MTKLKIERKQVCLIMMYQCVKLSKYVDTINVLNNYTALSALMSGLIIGLFFFLVQS